MMVDSALAASLPKRSSLDRLDAAHALLGVPDALETIQEETPRNNRPRSNSVGLDALADVASTLNDSETMPPPPRRPRSQSNPEGMEKWDSLSSRQDLILPSSILEEELKEASALAKQRSLSLPIKKRSLDDDDEQDYSSSPNSVASPIMSATVDSDDDNADSLTPEELLQRARSRLLEDLSEGNLKGEKGVLTLPHSLSKYKEVYNKNGRIGIYTPAERAAIITRFHAKRSRRVWQKKIRYNCRKNLADRRLRVKGRFVKRSAMQPPPDITDPDAGFCPTAELPYRRCRRHTIT